MKHLLAISAGPDGDSRGGIDPDHGALMAIPTPQDIYYGNSSLLLLTVQDFSPSPGDERETCSGTEGHSGDKIR
jgi:hypothetical protein